MTIAQVPELDAAVGVWGARDGWTARIDDRAGWRQTITPHRTALDAICAIAATTPQPDWVRDLVARAIAGRPSPLVNAAPLSSAAGGSLRGDG